MVRIRVGVLVHRLSEDEEDCEGYRHHKEVSSHLDKHRLLEVDLDEHVPPNLNKKFHAGESC